MYLLAALQRVGDRMIYAADGGYHAGFDYECVASFRPWLGGHMPATIGRRDLIAGLGGVAIVWPPTAPAQGVNREQAEP